MFVGLKRISTALGLLAATPFASQAQSMAPGTNQATADAVAGSLRASRALSGHRIEIQTTNGLVTLSGQVANPAQKAEAIARARSVAGVSAVNDQIQVAGDRGVLPVQYQQVALGHHGGHGRRLWRRRGRHGRGADRGRRPPGMVDGRADARRGGRRHRWRPRAGTADPNYAWPSYAPYRTTSRPSATRPSTPGRPGRTSARRTRTPKSPSTGGRSPSAGTTASGGSTSRSTTPGRSSPRIRSASSPTDRDGPRPSGMRSQPEGRVDSFRPALGAFEPGRRPGRAPTDRRPTSPHACRGRSGGRAENLLDAVGKFLTPGPPRVR